MSYHNHADLHRSFDFNKEVILFFQGFRDGLMGVFGLYKLQELENKSRKASDVVLLTELQQRRLAREAIKDDSEVRHKTNKK